MPLFRYKAISKEGKTAVGIIDADSYEMAKERLIKQKILITKLISIERKTTRFHLDAAILLSFTRDVSQLLLAGLPLYESIVTIEEKYRKHPAHRLFLDICDRLRSGAQLSHILKDYPSSFDPIYLSMIQAGEKTGALPWVFEQLYLLIERKHALKRKLKSAAAYPLFLAGFSFCVMMAILLFVIPSMRQLFEGRELHSLTRTVLGVSDFIHQHYLIMTAGLFSLIVLGYILWKEKQQWISRIFLKIPLVKTILTEAALVRFCRSLSLLLTGGMPLAQALIHARATLHHHQLDKEFAYCESKLTEGKSLSDGLKESKILPPLISRMALLAEETGKMPQSFQHLGEMYDQELERHLSQITTFLQPILLLILGAIVGIMILSILIPLTDFSSFIS